ncbi:unnamed protein product [Allacma fusca]|uniref:Mitochondrial carrier-like protein 2 n=1 Tax=Allacma fusca TaxID=39272 RepID=A0A8J2JA31_9HEXA|nr:unnamed protein product [Allacma fusca]
MEMSDDEGQLILTPGMDFNAEELLMEKDEKKRLDKSSILLRAGVTTAFYPVEYVKTLMQIGYEPFLPVNSHTLLGRRCLLLPNSFNYIQYIKRVDGFTGCFRGLAPRLIQQSVFMYVNQVIGKALHVKDDLDDAPTENEQITLSAHLGEGDRPDSPHVEIVRITSSRRSSNDDGYDVITWRYYLKNLCYDWCRRMASLVISFPFQVIAIRTMAEFVGREGNFSNGLMTGVIHIYEDHGILGFFRGLVPRLIGDSIHLFACGALRYLIRSQVYCEEVRACMGVSTSILVGSLTYPFTVVSNTMMVCGAKNIAMGNPPLMPNYKNWIDCWHHLASINHLKRGSSIFFRYYPGPRKVLDNGLTIPIGVPFGPDLQRNNPVIIL